MQNTRKLITAVAVFTAITLLGAAAHARTLLKNICHVKGQEENTLEGLGLVVGLKGTGDSSNSTPTVRSLARAIQLMGTPVGKRGPLELKEDIKNVALVMVTATVPAGGARQGDTLDCVVSSIGGAKSLAGGQLFITAMQGPQIESERVYGFAQGAIHLDNEKESPTSGKVFKGCRLEEDFFNPYFKDGKITLVLNRNKVDFQVAQDVAELINGQLGFQRNSGDMARAAQTGASQYRSDYSFAVSWRQAGAVCVASAEPADARSANRGPRGDQREGEDSGDRRQRRDRRRGRVAQRYAGGDRHGHVGAFHQPVRAAGNLADADAEVEEPGRHACAASKVP